jgi:peptidoglycan-associated lipoprotein
MMHVFSSLPRVLIPSLALACAGLLLSGCAKKATNVEPQEEPAPRYRAEPAPQPPAEAAKSVASEEKSATTTLAFENINFDYDKSELTSAARDQLARHAEVLRANAGVKILIEGHCDERGTIEYNLALGERRADAVMRYLTALGVERSRLSTISYGKERPLDYGHHESAWYKNRRAEFKIANR